MSEPMIVALLIAGPLLWMLGGTYHKGWRRIVWPIVAGVLLMLSSLFWWKALSVAILLSVVTALPYGDKTPWPVKIAVFMSLGIPALALNLSVWPVVLIAGLTVTSNFWLSQKYNWFTHKIFEGTAGFTQAICIVIGILK